MTLCSQLTPELLRDEDFMDQEARTAILDTLRDAATRPIDFTLHDFHVTGAAFGEVVQALEQRLIRVHYSASAGTRLAYCTDYDAFVVGFRSAINAVRKAAIVHEAVHAYADLRGARWMHVQTSEAAAHIAQYWYYLILTSGDEGALRGTDGPTNTLFAAAGRVAETLFDNRVPSHAEYEMVRTAVANVEEYRARLGTPIPYNGLRQDQ
jgi:hypothetical protein